MLLLGHETGHIAANHALTLAEAYAQRQSVLEVLGAMALRRIFWADAHALSFSREQGDQADTLSLVGMIAAGYDPAGTCTPPPRGPASRCVRIVNQGRTNRPDLLEWARPIRWSENCDAGARLGNGVL